MTYPQPPEILLTPREARLLRRLTTILSPDNLERLVAALEEVQANGQGEVWVLIYKGVPRFIKKMFTDDLRE